MVAGAQNGVGPRIDLQTLLCHRMARPGAGREHYRPTLCHKTIMLTPNRFPTKLTPY